MKLRVKYNRTIFVFSTLLTALLSVGFQPTGKTARQQDPLIAGFLKLSTASVADAVDQVVGRRGFMSHDMRPRVEGKIVGRARTALLRPAPAEKATAVLTARHSVGMIDEAKPGEVGVIVIENGLDVAAIGGLMGTTAKVRGMAGMILDAGVRDVEELRAMKLPVYSRSVVPGTTLGRFASVAKDVPVECAGVMVAPGDIIVADEDGVVSVPKQRAMEILRRAQEIDARESKMVPLIRQYKSLSKVVQIFNRI
jgi:regulator of RNase E activity RraA